MSKRRIFLLVSGVVIAVAVGGAAVWGAAAHLTSAQEVEEGAEVGRGGEEQGAELEAFRAKLVEFYGDLLEIEPYVAVVDPGLRQRIVKAQEMVAELAPEHLAELEEAFSENPVLFDLPKQLLSDQVFLRDMAQAGQRFAQAQRGLSQGLEYTDDPPPVGCPWAPDADVLRGMKLALQVAEGVQSFGPRDLTAVVAGVGGTQWAHPYWLTYAIVIDAYKAVIFLLDWQVAAHDSCVERNHKNLVSEYLDAKVSDTAQQDDLDAISPRDANGQRVPAASQDSLDDALEYDVALRKVDLQVTQLSGTGTFLILATDAGRPISNVRFINVRVGPESAAKFVDAKDDTTVTGLGNGMYLAKIAPKTYNGNGNSWSSWNARLFAFGVDYVDGLDHHYYGLTVFHGNNMTI